MLPPIIKLLRPEQWCKNVFVLLPLFFDKKFTDGRLLMLTLICFAVFSLAASAIYCLNDILDRKADAQHPVKCKRPIASGAVSVGTATVVMAVCAIAAIGLSWIFLPASVTWLMLGYMALNLAYSTWLKHLSLVDMLVVATFYVMRVLAGALAGGIVASQWIIVMTFLLALFLVLGKRRGPLQPAVRQHGAHTGRHRDDCRLHDVHHERGGSHAPRQPLCLLHCRVCAGGHPALPANHGGGEPQRQPHTGAAT